jgi:DNA-binding transcriptional LysR family regulator
MTLDQLEMIEAIVSEGSYQAASRILHKSQPSLSTGVKKIEELYGVQIFSREGYRPVLTTEGRRFFEHAQNTLASYRELHKVATELGAGWESHLKVAVDPVVSSHHLDPILNTLNECEFRPSLEFQSGILFDNAAMVQSGEVDLGVGHLPQVENDGIESHKLCSINLVSVIHRSLIGKNKLTNIFLSQVPNIIVRTAKKDNEQSNTKGLKWYVDSHARKSELIMMGAGWGRIPETHLVQSKEIIEIPQKVVEPLTLDIYLMRNKHLPHGPIARKIWDKFLLDN